MPRTCTICTHISRKDIEKQIVSGFSDRGISRQFGVGADSIHRHRRNHLQRAVQKALEKREIDMGGTILARLGVLQRESVEVLQSATEPETKLRAIARCEAQLRIEAELTGAFRKSSENQTDQDRNVRRFEGMIAAAIHAGSEIGRALTRDEAIEIIKVAGFPEITKYVN